MTISIASPLIPSIGASERMSHAAASIRLPRRFSSSAAGSLCSLPPASERIRGNDIAPAQPAAVWASLLRRS